MAPSDCGHPARGGPSRCNPAPAARVPLTDVLPTRAWLLCLALTACAAQAQLPREVLALARIKQKMGENLARTPDYVCIQTIERSSRPSAMRPFTTRDTVQLEVAHVGTEELYALPGARGFQEKQVSGMITGGMTSSGEFALHARSVFTDNTAIITYAGQEDLNGRRALRYDFRISLLFSGWTIRFGGSSGRVASYGSFWADADSLDLLRLDLHADDIPPDVLISSAVTRIEYARLRIGDSDVLLPQTAELVLADMLGHESRNRTEFSNCRKYQAQSALLFQEPVPAAATSPVAEIELPAGLSFPIQLQTPIDSDNAQVDGLITATLQSEVRHSGQSLVPKGALLKGRIRRLEKYSAPTPHFIVGLEFSELEFDGRHARFFGQLKRIAPVPGLSSAPGVATFFIQGTHFRLPQGLQMLWQTIKD